MNILGISCFYHDSAAALLHDGVLVAAAEEERFSRITHDFGFPEEAIAFCLEQGGIEAEDLDYVVYYEKPFVKFERILTTSLQTFPKSYGVFRESMITWLTEKLWVKNLISDKVARSDGGPPSSYARPRRPTRRGGGARSSDTAASRSAASCGDLPPWIEVRCAILPGGVPFSGRTFQKEESVDTAECAVLGSGSGATGSTRDESRSGTPKTHVPSR